MMTIKRILTILICLVAAVACEHAEGPGGQGAGNPLAECVLPESVRAGEDVLVQWNGFAQDAVVRLVSAEGAEHEVVIDVVTASGLVFTVSADIAPGKYALLIDQNGQSVELGVLEVLAAGMPVTGLKVPSGVKEGEAVHFDGIGFEDGCELVFVNSDGSEYTVEAELTYSGVSVSVPSNVVPGTYEVYLHQNGMKWLLSSSFSVYGALVVKTLQRLDLYSPYIGTVKLRQSWEIVSREPAELAVSEYLVDGGEISLNASDRYVSEDGTFFELAADGREQSNDMEMTYQIDESGSVFQADVLIYGKKVPTSFTWSYDAEGFLNEISSPDRSFRSFSYEDGNMTGFRNTVFVYDDPELVNHPDAADAVWAYIAMQELNDPFVCIPYLMGWNIRSSCQLPTAVKMPDPSDPSGIKTVTEPLEYEFDEDGYVSKMSWGKEHIDFVY